MKVPFKDFGKFGVVHDTLNASLPVGVWSDARNMRFTGNHVEKMLEPVVSIPFDSATYGPAQWMQAWSDGLSVQIAVATQTQLWLYQSGGPDQVGAWVNATRATSAYSTEGEWDSFPWGDTCIFNNGVDAPQIFNPGSQRFIDLPKWGLVSTADDISDNAPPSRDVNASTKILVPYKNFLLACGISEGGTYQPNTIWWSDATALATYSTTINGGGPPSWDYESPATLSAKSECGIGDGGITCAKALNENIIVYTEKSATAVQYVGGGLVMNIRRLFGKGAAGQQCAEEFNNHHYVLSRDQIYVHDGSAVKLIAKDRIEEEFFRRIGKGGRFGGDVVDWEKIQVIKNPDRKEIYTIFGGSEGENTCPDTPNVGREVVATLLWDQQDGDVVDVAGPQGLFGVDGKNIMSMKENDTIVVSRDLGQTWVDTGATLPGGSGYDTSKFLYNPALNIWYVSRENSPIRATGVWWSDDLGETWNLMTRDDLQRASTCLDIDPSTNYVYAADERGEALFAWTDPRYNGTDPAPWYNLNQEAGNYDNLAIIGDYILTSRQGGSQQYVDIMGMHDTEAAFEADTAVRYEAVLPFDTFDFTPWSEVYRNELVFVARPVNEVGGTTTAQFNRLNPVDMIAAGTTVPAPLITVDFEEAIDMARLNVSPEYFVAIARPKNAQYSNDRKFILKWATDPVTPDWSHKIKVTLPYVPFQGGNIDSLHIEWAEDNKWVIGYKDTEGEFMKLVLIDLCIEAGV